MIKCVIFDMDGTLEDKSAFGDDCKAVGGDDKREYNDNEPVVCGKRKSSV